MSSQWANIIFDKNFRPSDFLEDKISEIENPIAWALDFLIEKKCIDKETRKVISTLLALQVCRYQNSYQKWIDRAKYLAIALSGCRWFKNVEEFNTYLRSIGMFPGVEIREEEFRKLRSNTSDDLKLEADEIIAMHGYEYCFNPEFIIDSRLLLSEYIMSREWDLYYSEKSEFIMSDRPVPEKIGACFSVSLTANYGLVIRQGKASRVECVVSTRASSWVVESINKEVIGRAKKYICGSDESVCRYK